MHVFVALITSNPRSVIYSSQKPKLEESSAPAAKRGRRPERRSIEPPEKKKKPEDSRTECCVCKQSGTNSNLVRYAAKFTIVTETIMPLVYPFPHPPEFGITIVSDFSWDDCNTQEKLWCIMVLVKVVKISTFLKSPQSVEELYRPFPHPEIPSSFLFAFIFRFCCNILKLMSTLMVTSSTPPKFLCF